MTEAIRRAIRATAWEPLAPGWETVSPERRPVAALAYVLANSSFEELERIIWSEHWQRNEWAAARSCRWRLREIGADWLGKAILSLALAKPSLAYVLSLRVHCQRLASEREQLWESAIAYALKHGALPVRIVR